MGVKAWCVKYGDAKWVKNSDEMVLMAYVVRTVG